MSAPRSVRARALLAMLVLALAPGCGASGPSADAPPRAPSGWTRFVDPSMTFELALPPSASLVRDAFAPADSEYWYWAPEQAGSSNFSVLRKVHAADLNAALIDSERSLGASVDVDIDERTSWRGVPAHRVRAETERDVERTWQEDPSTGRSYHMPETEEREVIDFLAFRGRTTSLRVGYRLDRSASADVEDTFDAMVESFRLRRPLP